MHTDPELSKNDTAFHIRSRKASPELDTLLARPLPDPPHDILTTFCLEASGLLPPWLLCLMKATTAGSPGFPSPPKHWFPAGCGKPSPCLLEVMMSHRQNPHALDLFPECSLCPAGTLVRKLTYPCRSLSWKPFSPTTLFLLDPEVRYKSSLFLIAPSGSYLLFFLSFLGPLSWHMEVSRLGV